MTKHMPTNTGSQCAVNPQLRDARDTMLWFVYSARHATSIHEPTSPLPISCIPCSYSMALNILVLT